LAKHLLPKLPNYSQNTESANGAEEVNEPEKSLPTDFTEAAYVVDDASPRTRLKRETLPPAHVNKNSSEDEIANVYFCTTTTYM